MTVQKNGSAADSRPSLWRLLPLALLLLGAAAVFATGTHHYLSLEALIQQREQLQSFVASRGSTAMHGTGDGCLIENLVTGSS